MKRVRREHGLVEGRRGKGRVLEHVAEEGIDVVLIAPEGGRVKANLAGGPAIVFVVVALMRKEGSGDVSRRRLQSVLCRPLLDLKLVATATERVKKERANL